MKMILLALIMMIGFIIVAGYINAIIAKTEIQKYEVLFKKDDFEIRYYPESVMASVTLSGTYDDMRNTGFRKLAGYIFGSNEKNMKIAMTAPVRMTSKENSNTMSFVMPSKMEMENLPDPVNKDILIHKSQPVYTASIRFGGYASNSVIDRVKGRLENVLKEFNIGHANNFEYLGYNPPYQLINRRNEVLVELEDFNPQILNK